MTTHHGGPVLERGYESEDRLWFDNLPVGIDPDHVVLFDDFVGVDDDQTNDWTVVKDTGASVDINDDTALGVLLLSSAATTDNDGSSIQGNEIFLPADGRTIWFKARFQLSDSTQMDAFVGLVENFATNPEAILTASNRIGFQKDDGNQNILAKSESGDTETSEDTDEDVADATYVEVAFVVHGTDRIDYFVNGVKVKEITTNIPTTELAVAAFELSGDASGTKTMSLDYILAVCTR